MNQIRLLYAFFRGHSDLTEARPDFIFWKKVLDLVQNTAVTYGRKELHYNGKVRTKMVMACFHRHRYTESRTPLHMDGGLDYFFPNSILLDIAKDGFTII